MLQNIFIITSQIFSRLPVRLLAETSSNPAGTIYQFSAKDIEGNEVDMSRYRGQVCVVVNVASRWGKTKANYSQLVQLYNKYNKVGWTNLLKGKHMKMTFLVQTKISKQGQFWEAEFWGFQNCPYTW